MLANGLGGGGGSEGQYAAMAMSPHPGNGPGYDMRSSEQPQQYASTSRLPGQASAARNGPSHRNDAVSPRSSMHDTGRAGPSSNAASPSAAAGPSSPSSPMPTTAASLMREGPRDFTVIRDVGDGSFGTVCLADWKSPLPSGTLLSPMQHPTTRPEYVGKRLVAIKKMKKPFPSWEECMKLKELKSLLAIPHHPNIIPLYDAFLMPGTKELHFVFECMEGNLYQLTKSRKGRPLAGGLVASIFQQIVQGLHHIHKHGYFHRDMKPENLLITTTGLADYPASSPLAMPGSPPEKDVLVIVKLADFGLARETQSQPPYTEYVSTRWYRAPEVLLRSRDYSNPVDMWALGTILAEMVNLKPLFPGQSEVDQVLQICEVLGDPTRDYGIDERGRRRGGGEWMRGIRMAKNVGFEFPMAQPITFSTLFSPKVPPSLVDCIQDLLRYDPTKRLTTADCLRHTYAVKIAPRLQPPQARAVVSSTSPEQAANMARQQQRQPAQANQQSFGVASRLAAGDLQAQHRSIPPSHSNVPQLAPKPPFGAGQPIPVGAQQHIRVRQAQGADGDVQMDAASPRHVLPSAEIAFVQGQHRNSGSSYPAFPDSASAYTSTASHGSGTRDDIDMERTETSSTLPLMLDRRQQQQQQQQRGMVPQQTHGSVASSEELEMVRTFDQVGVPSRHPMSSQDLRYRDVKNASATSSLASHPGSTSSEPDFRPAGHISSNETIASKGRKGKGWGMGVLGGKGAQQQSIADESVRGAHAMYSAAGVNAQDASGRGGVTPAQQIVAEQAATKNMTPAEAKKAKKEAEKAAREAEKSKRAAQEKAARERARAVMQKRNQILASSNTRDQVEWLSMAENDMTRALQQQPQQAPQPQMQQGGPQSSQSSLGVSQDPPFPSFATQQRSHAQQQQYSAQGQPVNFTQPQQQPYSFGSEKFWGKQPRLSSSTSDHSANSLYSARLGNSYSPLPHNAALRPIDSGDEEYFEDPRRRSMLSFQTRESDPGPGRGRGNSGSYMGARPGSDASLNSAPGLIDAATLAAQQRPRFAERVSADNVSVASSLDHQLITNLENMTAAESNAHAHYSQEYASPAPAHLGPSRPSISRQSHGSHSSAQRQGSASPMHYTAAPRFHPYSGSSGTGPSSQAHPQSPHGTYALPSLAASLAAQQSGAVHDGGIESSIGPTRPRSLSRRMSHGQGPHRGMSQGSSTSRDGSMRQNFSPGHFHQHLHAHPPMPSSSSGHGPPLQQQHSGMSGGDVHPMFHVQSQSPSQLQQQQGGPLPMHSNPVLPRFAELAASTGPRHAHMGDGSAYEHEGDRR